MDDKTTVIDSILNRMKQLSKTSLELYKLKSIEKLTQLTTVVLVLVIFLFAVALVISVLSVGCAIGIGDCLGSAFYGFLAMGGILMLLSTLIYVFRKKLIIEPIERRILKAIFTTQNERN